MPRPRKIAPEAVPGATADTAPSPAPAAVPSAAPAPAKKTDLVLTLLARDEGATEAEMMAVTGWLAHSTRAALTGLRKKGHALVRTKRNDVTCYRLAAGE